MSETSDLDNFSSASPPIWIFWTLLMKWIIVCDVWIRIISVIKSAGKPLNFKNWGEMRVFIPFIIAIQVFGRWYAFFRYNVFMNLAQ